MQRLEGIKVINLAVNLPGPAAAQRLSAMGAEVIKVEPPSGDPMASYSGSWYREMAAGHVVRRIDLKAPEGRAELFALLQAADVLLSATRPSAMRRLGLDPGTLQQAFPRLCQVVITGYLAPREDEPGHDLTYQASMGLVDPPHLPRALVSDMAGAERAVQAALVLLYHRERTGEGGCETISLAEGAEFFAGSARHGLTLPGALLGGELPEYHIYRATDGWVAVAALEPHFKQRLESLLKVTTPEDYRRAFGGASTTFWQAWGQEHDVPIETVR